MRAGWTTSDDVAPSTPQGWAPWEDWADDSAAAAGRFFEEGTKPARPGSQGWAKGGWAESGSVTAEECVPGLRILHTWSICPGSVGLESSCCYKLTLDSDDHTIFF